VPFKSDKQRKWMYANEPEMAKKWEKEEAIRGKLRNLIKQEVKSVNEMPNFDRGTSGLPRGFIDDYTKIVKKLSKGKGYATLSRSDKKKVWATLGKIYNESVNEGKWSKIMRSVRKGSKAGPWSIVVYKNKKVLHQRLVKILQQIPAHYEDVKKKYPKASIGIEDKYGERVYTESINEADLGLTYKKGKTVKVTHKKSGKELVIIDKPNVRKEYEKIGFFAEGKVWDRRKNIDKLREAFRPKGVSLMKRMVLLKKDNLYFDPGNGNFWLLGKGNMPDWEDEPIEPRDYDYKKTLKGLSSNGKALVKKSLRGSGNWKEATTSVSVPGYLSPYTFSKSTQQAIDVDDEDDEVEEAYKVDIDKLLQSPKIKKLMKRLGIRKSQSQQGAIQLLNYFANNPHALAAFKKLAVGESMAAPFRRRKSRGLGRVMKVGLNEVSMLPFSSPEAKQQVDRDVTTMSKHLGKTSQQIIKIMMDGVKSGQYDAMDLQRGIQTGSIARTHFGELDFIQQLWRKVRSGFRRYSKRGKLR
jgi:hypothetical protein